MAMIANVFVSKLCEMLLSYAKDEAVALLGVPDEIKKLHRRMMRMLVGLADAENRRFDNDAINLWLNELRDLMYDADDIIDECRIEGEKLLGSSSSASVRLVRRCFPPVACLRKVRFHHEIGNRIRDLSDRLDELAKDKADLNLSLAPPHDHHKSTGISRKTSPVLVEPDLVGEKIKDDTRRLVDLLIKEYKKKIPIIAVVGMGGIGKTTLAQKIFNDEKLRDSFNQMPLIWSCVSQDFSESELLRSVIKKAGGDPGEDKEKDVLELMLSQVITNKKFFLILDDVWDARVWDELLRKPLLTGALPDSRILMTTRNKNIAEQMGAIYTHTVDKLSQEDGWSLICKIVFEQGDERDMHLLSDVGMKIVEKCDGLPLALRTVGGVLRTKAKRPPEWVKVLSSPAWSFTKLPNGEMGPLYLSYLDLPPPLKQCFTWLSLFPEDYLIHDTVFINSCIAEGFISSKDNTPLEDVAEGYWKDLVQRNLLQPDSVWYDGGGCRMHDLLRSLAQHIAQDECFVGDARAFENKIVSLSSSSSIKLRRLSIIDGKLDTISELIRKQTSMRTLSFFDSPLIHDLPEDLFTKLSRLRVLNLRETTISKLPTSLGDLVHLRRLDLGNTPIREVPESIGNLRNLQFLILRDCKYLLSLPSGVMGLTNLRVLDVEDAALDGLPVGIGRLQQLYSLNGFVVNGSEGRKSGVGGDDREQEPKSHQHGRFCTLEELKSLSQLRIISMYKLERVSNRAEARAAALQAKLHLVDLNMHCTSPSSCSDVQQPRTNDYEDEEIKRIGEVFEEHCPPPCLELLQIEGYFGREFPSWMMTPSSSSLHNLRRLDLNNCALCQQLPPLGMLPQIDYLWIKGAPAVTSIGREFLLLGSCFSSYFPKLEILRFEDMANWEDWWWRWEEEDNLTTSLMLPSLNTLSIHRCPKLSSLPESLLRHAIALKTLDIREARSLREVQNLPSLTELILVSNSSLERVSNIPALKYLDVEDCEELKVVEGVDAVEHIKLYDREVEESLPEWLVGAGEEQARFPSLHKLTLKNKICRRGLPDWPLI